MTDSKPRAPAPPHTGDLAADVAVFAQYPVAERYRCRAAEESSRPLHRRTRPARRPSARSARVRPRPSARVHPPASAAPPAIHPPAHGP
ncbi:hypothetical protein FRAAL3798 [Frankia alni ACN14a]|uniref:Uncharacterized protein n=1 Tax=Frankia alni (strain DSM 45986 / CECT 9034 / ACN14a) TaxID=326424 RepID=Q0RJ71_FRAAA|nr:hypothetical protein FRAAL3798 [Frankia alni ACN14a]